GEGGTRRRRRRTRAERVGSTFEDGGQDAASPTPPAEEGATEGTGTHDGHGKEHHDGKPAPARRRRRRRRSGGAGQGA
ncbi:MAG: ATP-dependent helicase, partial [Microbacterium sp.]